MDCHENEFTGFLGAARERKYWTHYYWDRAGQGRVWCVVTTILFVSSLHFWVWGLAAFSLSNRTPTCSVINVPFNITLDTNICFFTRCRCFNVQRLNNRENICRCCCRVSLFRFWLGLWSLHIFQTAPFLPFLFETSVRVKCHKSTVNIVTLSIQ